MFDIGHAVRRFDKKVAVILDRIVKHQLTAFVFQFFYAIAAAFENAYALFFQAAFGQCDRKHDHSSSTLMANAC